jgi:hypothetical protein
MNYFRPYSPAVDETIFAAWDSQIAEAKETPWLAEALGRAGGELFPRFVKCYAEIRALPRGARRALQRQLARSRELAAIPPEWQQKLARTLAGAALLLALGGGAAEAATMVVKTSIPGVNADGKCSLIEAILNANADAQVSPDCPAGSGADTIKLPVGKTHTLTSVYGYYSGPTGLPEITTDITIQGNSAKIVRGSGAPEFRIMAVSGSGALTLKNLKMSGGAVTDYYGGGIFVDVFGALTMEKCTISGNTAAGSPATYDNSSVSGGGIYNSYHGTVTITNSTISGNTAVSGAAGEEGSYYDSRAFGGGIFNHDYGTLTITNSTISGNVAKSDTAGDDSYARGGGIFNDYRGTLVITNSTISGNTAVSGVAAGDDSKAYGGGVYNNYRGTLTITNSTISGNTAVSNAAEDDSKAYGGGVFNDYHGTLTIENSTISGNVASSGTALDDSRAYGGGIFSNSGYVVATITNSTISGNTAVSGTALDSSDAYGGGIKNSGTMTIQNSTISGNTAVSASAGSSDAYGGGIHTSSYLTLSRSLISGNTADTGPEIYNNSTVSTYDYNIFGFSGSSGVVGFSYGGSDIVPGVPLGSIIGPLSKNGGPTKTHALLPGSPARNASPIAGCPATDQRGVARPRGPGCDIGSFEK